MADQDWQAPAGNGNNDRSPSPRGARARSRSRSPVRADPDRREGGDRGRGNDRSAEVNPGNNIHVSGLSSRVEERDLEEVFGKFGRIQKTAIMRDPHTKDSRGFAFVTMELPEDAETAITNLNATELMGRTMNVQIARRGRARTPTPGAYHGPPKRSDPMDRPYEPRGYSSRGGGGGRYDDRYEPRGGYSSSRYDDRGSYGARYDDRERGGYAIPMRGGDDRAPRDDRRRYDDDRRRYDDRDRYDRRY
ncbi:RNA recognition motif domain-containing protein [Sporobolomyces salmoneus]|uniref:RNA recognition motif domain-containing protein n=1 Tax=Sporobolomyces salmoneus TaxID=183962 RepID=UPI003174C0AF